MIQIARVYERVGKSSGWRILVDRLWPRGMKKENAHVDFWMKDIAPSDALRKWFGHDPKKWTEFQKKYRAELADKEQLLRELKQMEKKYGTVTLLFAAKDAEHNQAVVLSGVLKNKK